MARRELLRVLFFFYKWNFVILVYECQTAKNGLANGKVVAYGATVLSLRRDGKR